MTDGVDGSLASDSNLKGAVCYVPFIGWIISVFFILTERDDHFVRFNALQSLLLLILYVLLSMFLDLLSRIFFRVYFISLLIGAVKYLLLPAYLLVSVFLIYKALQSEKQVLPVLGPTALKHM